MGLCLPAGHVLPLRRRICLVGLTLGHVLAAAGVRIPILRVLALHARSALVVLMRRLLSLLVIGRSLPTGSILRSPRIVAVGTSLACRLVFLTLLTLLTLLCTILIGVTLLLAAVTLLLAGLLRVPRIVTVGPSITCRLTLAAVPRALGMTALARARFIALRAAGFVLARSATFGTPAFSGFRRSALRHAFIARGSGGALRHSASRMAGGTSRHALFASRRALFASTGRAAARTLRGCQAYAGVQHRRRKQ